MAQQVNLSVTTQEAQVIMNLLAAQPWKDVNPLMQKLIGQLNAQMAPKPAAAPSPKTESPKPEKPKKAKPAESKKDDTSEPDK